MTGITNCNMLQTLQEACYTIPWYYILQCKITRSILHCNSTYGAL